MDITFFFNGNLFSSTVKLFNLPLEVILKNNISLSYFMDYMCSIGKLIKSILCITGGETGPITKAEECSGNFVYSLYQGCKSVEFCSLIRILTKIRFKKLIFHGFRILGILAECGFSDSDCRFQQYFKGIFIYKNYVFPICFPYSGHFLILT